jgi:hypothetical protein
VTGVSAREIGRTLGVARSTIQDNLKRAAVAGLAWPLAGDLTDAVLEQCLFAYAGVKRGFRRRAEPDWGSLACELKRPGVNLMVLWEEYRAVDPAGYTTRQAGTSRHAPRRISRPVLMPYRSVDLDAFLSVNAHLNRRVGDDVVIPMPFENRLHSVLRRAVPRVSRVRE